MSDADKACTYKQMLMFEFVWAAGPGEGVLEYAEAEGVLPNIGLFPSYIPR